MHGDVHGGAVPGCDADGGVAEWPPAVGGAGDDSVPEDGGGEGRGGRRGYVGLLVCGGA